MPVQTTIGNIVFPDGAKAQIKPSGSSSWTDMGALNSAISLVLNYTENQINTANYGKTIKQIREMTVDGSFTLINYDPNVIASLGGGIFEVVDTAGSAVITCPDQTIAAGWEDNTLYDLDIQTSSSDSTQLKASAKPTLTSVTLDPDGTSPEVLVENTDYVIVENANSTSGYSIQFISANMGTTYPTTFEIVIDYASVTPIARKTTYAGSSTQELSAYGLKFTHTDGNGKIREVELYSVDPNAGSFNINFKGSNEDGVEEFPIAFTGNIDTSRTNGRQLLAWVVDTGAL